MIPSIVYGIYETLLKIFDHGRTLFKYLLRIQITFACVILLIFNLLDEYTCNFKITI